MKSFLDLQIYFRVTMLLKIIIIVICIKKTLFNSLNHLPIFPYEIVFNLQTIKIEEFRFKLG